MLPCHLKANTQAEDVEEVNELVAQDSASLGSRWETHMDTGYQLDEWQK